MSEKVAPSTSSNQPQLKEKISHKCQAYPKLKLHVVWLINEIFASEGSQSDKTN
jgi:hypothetical protein